MNTHPGFYDFTPQQTNEIIKSCQTRNSFVSKQKQIILSSLPAPPDFFNDMLRSNYYDKYFTQFKYYLPIQFPDCYELYIRETIFNGNVYLGSTIGLPSLVYNTLKIVQQKYLDLNDLNYCGIKEVVLISSIFPNLNFLKTWNPQDVSLANINFKNFGIFGDELTNLQISNDCDEIDFSEITDLKNLLDLHISSNKNVREFNPVFNKERYINVINMLNLSSNVCVSFNTWTSDNNVYNIMKKYFLMNNKQEYIMDCLIELLEAGYIYAAGKNV